MKTRCFAAVLVVLLGTVGFVIAEAPAPDDSVADEFRQLGRDIPSLYLINGLHLSKEQAGQLAGLLERANNIEEEHDKKYRKIARLRQKDFESELDDVLTMASKKGEVDQRKLSASAHGKRVMQSRRELFALTRERQDGLNKLSDKAYKILTESQRSIVGSFVPCFIPPSDFRNPERVGQASEDTSIAENVLVRLKRIPDEQCASIAVERALDHLAPYVMQTQHMQYSEEAEESVRDELAPRLESAAVKIRAMSDADFELEKKNIAAEILSLGTAGKSNDEGAIRWKMGTYVLNTGIEDVIRARAGLPGKLKSSSKSPTATPCHKPGEMKRTMRTAALINGLDLTPGQAAEMLTIVRGALETKESAQKDAGHVMEQGIEKYKQLRTELADGQPTKETEEGAGRYHQRVVQLCDDQLVAKLLEYQADLDRCLTASQVGYLTGDMKDKFLKEPIGDQDTGKAMNRAKRLMSDARRMSPMEFSRKKKDICLEFINEYIAEQKLSPHDIDIEAEAERTGDILEHAQKLGNSEYNANRDEMAADLCPRRSEPRPATYGSKYVRGTPVPMLSPSSGLLFSKAAFSLLEKMSGSGQ